jgi:hypothetical protein
LQCLGDHSRDRRHLPERLVRPVFRPGPRVLAAGPHHCGRTAVSRGPWRSGPDGARDLCHGERYCPLCWRRGGVGGAGRPAPGRLRIGRLRRGRSAFVLGSGRARRHRVRPA